MVYVTDCLRGILVGRGAKVTRFYDILHPAKVDERSPKEIINDISTRAGLKVVKSRERTCTDSDAGN